ncbi:MAG TPA: hypothetical protein VH022_14065 [Candidatus Acidoferrum sp.]|jgi:hypothetical protein|nr:hypothetical protein [Candidatus Acidoferrum sp.]
MHEEPQIQIPDPARPEGGGFNFALILALAAVVVIVAAFYFSPGRQSPPGAAPQASHFAFGAAEQAYATSVHIENIALSRAENFLNQEVTTLTADAVNGGTRSLRGIEITITFADDMNQIALRESRAVVAPPNPPLAAGEHRQFDIAFEHIPTSWNMQQPIVRITGLEFAP